MKPTQSILILLSLLLISNCGEKVREEIRERFDNGDKKLLVKYKGEGGDEVVVERITYGKSGDTLFWEKPLEDFYYEKIREEIIKRFDNGDKELLVKYKGEGSDKVIDERITYSESGDTLILEKILEKMKMVREYYENGQIKSEENYKDRKENGKWKEDGKWTYFYENGQIKEEINYKDGFSYTINFWTEDGELMVKDGNGKLTSYYENGQIASEGNTKDGKEDGKWTLYYENGQIWIEGNYKDGEKNGKWTSYHENGQIWWYRNYKDGEEDGEPISYLLDGSKLN